MLKIKLYLFIAIFITISCANSSELYLSDITIPIRNGDTEKAISLINDNAEIIKSPSNLFELLKTSIRSNNKNTFDRLKSFEFDYNYTNKSGRNLLFFAAAQENTYYIKYILGKNPFIDHKEIDRDTAFSVAAATYNLAAMKLLIEHGAKDLDSHATSTAVPLNVAVAHQDVELVEMMLERGADPNHQYEAFYKEFPLQIAIEKNNPDIVKLLLKYKADPNKLTCYGETPLYLAQQGYYYDEKALDSKQEQIVKLLETYKAELPKTKPRNRATSGSFRRPGC